MLETNKELVKEKWIRVRVGRTTSQSRQRDLEITQEAVLSAALFLVAINEILRELGSRVDKSLLAD